MAPPTVQDEDLDDLDDVLDQFNPSTSTSKPSPASSTSAPPPPPSKPTPSLPPTSFPDPDDDALPSDELDPAISQDLEQGMKALFEAMSGGGGGGIPGLEGQGEEGEDGDFDDEEFKRAMEELMKNGVPGGEGGGADSNELQQLMAALGMGGSTSAPTTTTSAAKPSTTAATSAKGKDKSVPTATTSQANPTPTPANFQDAIAASLSKMQNSSSTASAAAAQSQESAGGAAGLASMLAGLSGMPDLSQLGDLGGEEGLQGMLDEMMKQLMSREMLYEPLKELSEKYPAYLTSARPTLSSEDLDRYTRQQSIVSSIVSKFEEPGADKPLEQQSPSEKERSEARTEEVVELVAKMNECGAPPKDIMGEMPPGMELGPDGVPKIPECTIC